MVDRTSIATTPEPPPSGGSGPSVGDLVIAEAIAKACAAERASIVKMLRGKDRALAAMVENRADENPNRPVEHWAFTLGNGLRVSGEIDHAAPDGFAIVLTYPDDGSRTRFLREPTQDAKARIALEWKPTGGGDFMAKYDGWVARACITVIGWRWSITKGPEFYEGSRAFAGENGEGWAKSEVAHALARATEGTDD